jgi:hypothetical protein
VEIVVRQFSGLGNQLFQYAAGKYFARQTGAELRLATDRPRSQISHGYPRPFLLSHFSIPAPMQPLTRLESAIFAPHPLLRPARVLLKAALGIQVYNEPLARRHTFIEQIPLRPGIRTLYLFGYWQSHRIVDAVAADLRRDLAFRDPPSRANLELLDRIARTPNAVSLHVRRGDFTLAAEGNRALPLAYYADAIAYFQQRLEDPTFFVFSDDMAFTRHNLPGTPRGVFVDHNDDASSFEDLRLMSACHHHIIANSSFSWWGAWLNARPDKLVYAPRYWMTSPDSYYPGLLPPDWILGSSSLKEAGSRANELS